jgi:adenylate cyclase
MLLFWGLGTGAPVAGLILVAILTLTLGDVSLTKLTVVVLVLGAVVLCFGLLVTWLNGRAVVAPVLAVRDAMQAVEEGDFDTELQVYDGTELGQLQAGFNQMVRGLRDREHLRDLFGRHVGRHVAEAASNGEVELGGETRVVSVLFVDLIGSTELTTERDPVEVVELLNRFFAVVVEEVDRRDGLVNKFIGDAVLAIFGAPLDLDDHATHALEAGRTMAGRLAEEVPELAAGIGIATGEVVAGNVGEESRFEYTVIGDAVNAAARLTDLAKDVDGRVLAAWESVETAAEPEAELWQRHDTVTLRGRSSETVLAVPTRD